MKIRPKKERESKVMDEDRKKRDDDEERQGGATKREKRLQTRLEGERKIDG